MNVLLLLISFLAFTGYVAYIWIKFGVRSSISNSFYWTNNPRLFAAFIWGSMVPLMIVGDTLMVFLAGALMCFVGASPDYRKALEGKVHVATTYAGIIIGILAMIFEHHLYVIPGLMILFILMAKAFELKNKTWWVEIVAYYGIWLGIWIAKVF